MGTKPPVRCSRRPGDSRGRSAISGRRSMAGARPCECCRTRRRRGTQPAQRLYTDVPSGAALMSDGYHRDGGHTDIAREHTCAAALSRQRRRCRKPLAHRICGPRASRPRVGKLFAAEAPPCHMEACAASAPARAPQRSRTPGPRCNAWRTPQRRRAREPARSRVTVHDGAMAQAGALPRERSRTELQPSLRARYSPARHGAQRRVVLRPRR